MMKRNHTLGFTMIELLVAVIILSVGLIGLAGMQITGLRGINNASNYSLATLTVNDIVERVRANPVASNDNNSFDARDSAVHPDFNCAAMPNPYCSDTNGGNAQACTPAQMAAFDLNIWFCGENNGAGGRFGGAVNTFQAPRLQIDCLDANPPNDPANPGAGTFDDGDPCTYGSPHSVIFSWNESDPDRDNVDQDGNGDPETITRTISLTIQP